MPKFCPIIKADCLEAKCQLWVPVNQKNFGCAFAAIPSILARDLGSLRLPLTDLSRTVVKT